jgi:hypothetical protein
LGARARRPEGAAARLRDECLWCCSRRPMPTGAIQQRHGFHDVLRWTMNDYLAIVPRRRQRPDRPSRVKRDGGARCSCRAHSLTPARRSSDRVEPMPSGMLGAMAAPRPRLVSRCGGPLGLRIQRSRSRREGSSSSRGSAPRLSMNRLQGSMRRACAPPARVRSGARRAAGERRRNRCGSDCRARASPRD